MIEKVIQVEAINLVDFLDVENKNIAELAALFPTAKIISKGNSIKIRGDKEVVNKLYHIIKSLIQHYHNEQLITQEIIHHCVGTESGELGATAPLLMPMHEKKPFLHTFKGKPIKAKTENQQKMVSSLRAHDLIFFVGPAGTGKTYMAMALALHALKSKEVEKIIITHPIVEADANLGFLPGYLEEKTAPYLYPIYDALDDMLSMEKRKHYQESGMIEIAPLAYMRGRTLHNAFVVLDEAQNTNSNQMRMFLTRMGLHAKFIITGDPSQIDLPHGKQSGLLEAISVLASVQGIGFVYLNEQDIVRHKLTKSIIAAYEKKISIVTQKIRVQNVSKRKL